MVGANGAGKTTLMKMLAGATEPDGGTLTVGETVKLLSVDQSREGLTDGNSVFEEICGGADVTNLELGQTSINARAYVNWFGFRASDHSKRVGVLSGGERNRVQLAKLLRSGANVMILDEPTNDLDTDTMRALEEALLEFAGCCIVVSHDRFFLDRTATHILAFEGDSKVRWFEGTFAEYEEDRKERLGNDTPRPLKFAPLVAS